MMLEIFVLIGIAGAFLVLVAFMLNEFHSKISPETVTYNLLNIAGSGLLMYYAYALQSWPFLFLNAVWTMAAIVKLVKISI